jgi:50S ribosome-binding GTPase
MLFCFVNTANTGAVVKCFFKMSKRTIILKKDDSQRPSRTQANQKVQPKILTKATNKDNVPSIVPAKKAPEPQETAPPPTMKFSHRLMDSHFRIDMKLLDEYVDGDNIDFLVVGIIGELCEKIILEIQFWTSNAISGKSNMGKSTLANIIASPQFVNIVNNSSPVTFRKEHEVFATNGILLDGNTIDMFITTDRIIILDTSPFLSNVQKRDMMISEVDDLKTLQILLQICHLILVVHDGLDMSAARLLKTADQMVPTSMKHRPIITYVANKFQPGSSLVKLDPRIHEDAGSILVPDLHHPGLSLHYDVSEVIQLLQEKWLFFKKVWGAEGQVPSSHWKLLSLKLFSIKSDKRESNSFKVLV